MSRFEPVSPPRAMGPFLDVDVTVECTTGTYVRALARDLGERVGVGGHLTMLRRTTVGPFAVDEAVDVFPDGVTPRGEPRPPIGDELKAAVRGAVIPVSAAVGRAFTVRSVGDDLAVDLGFGRRIPADGADGTYAVVDAKGDFLALVTESDGAAKPVFVWQAV